MDTNRNKDLSEFIKMLDDFRDYLRKGQNQEARSLLERIKAAYKDETGRSFEDDFPEEKITRLYELLDNSKKTTNIDNYYKEMLRTREDSQDEINDSLNQFLSNKENSNERE
ncbi:MAG: hypothetical protein IJ629_02010 [Clostridia bacterium]|nr:hypothetical protein [Clostridia bacterium]